MTARWAGIECRVCFTFEPMLRLPPGGDLPHLNRELVLKWKCAKCGAENERKAGELELRLLGGED